LDVALTRTFKDGKIPGAQTAIVENGQIVLLKSYGYADVAKTIPVTTETVFRAGSISKSFTSIAIMTAVEQRKLSLSAKLADVSPEVHSSAAGSRPIRSVW
jgi:CubicO group peptidase (beta-lactamase class C family)